MTGGDARATSCGLAIHPQALRLLHWATALLVGCQAGLAGLGAAVAEVRPGLGEAALQAHLSLGALLFAMTAVRLGCRLILAGPGAPFDLAPTARTAANGLHAALYALLLLLPLTGYVKLAALGFEIRLFALISLPALPLDTTLARRCATLHAAGAAALGGLLVLHIGAAVAHKWLFGMPVLYRMRLR